MALCTKDENVQEIASRYQVSRCSIYQWARGLLGEGIVSSVPKQNKAEEPKPATIEKLQSQVNDLTKQARELKDAVFRLRVERDVLEKAAEVATVSECTRSNTKKLTKTSITDELIKEVCRLYGDRYDDRDEDTSLGGRDWHPGELASHKSLLVFKRELEDEGIFLSTGKIRKILITGGLYSSERSREIAEEYKDCGGNVEEVADNLGLSIPPLTISH